MVAPTSPATPSPDFKRRHTLGQYLAHCLATRDGVRPEIAVTAGLRVATMPDLWDAVAAGRSIVVFAVGGFVPELFDHDGAARTAAALRRDCADAGEIRAVDIAPMVAALTQPVERN